MRGGRAPRRSLDVAQAEAAFRAGNGNIVNGVDFPRLAELQLLVERLAAEYLRLAMPCLRS